MPNLKQFKLPDVGEGLTEADILTWSVRPGDTVTVNQTLVEVETAKAAVELPSPFAGVVAELHADPGATVEVGTPIITIDIGGEPEAGAVDRAPAQQPSAAATDAPAADTGRQAVLVGYGPRSAAVSRRPRKQPAAVEEPVTPNAQLAFDHYPGAEQASSATPPALDEMPAAPTAEAPGPSATNGSAVLAKPPVRKLAKTLGVDLGAVVPSGPNGTVSRADVEAAATGTAAPAAVAGGAREQRIPIKGVRKHTAAAMVSSAFTAPHVTEFVTVDVSAMMELRQRVAARAEFAGVKVSPLLFLARAVIWATRRTPIVNATWDEAAGEIVIKNYVNLGIAAATDRGLIVPNIKNADTLSLRELADRLTALTETARAGKTTPADMSAGTITITNVGVFGIDTGTPIINPGESAIVAFGAVRRAPWVVHREGVETIEPRWVTQLAVSFDHRLVDGQAGSEFLADVAGVLADPGLALL